MTQPTTVDQPTALEDIAHEEARALTLGIADILADSPASDIVVLDVRDVSSLADFFVICSGENERQISAISEDIAEGLSANDIRPLRTEGPPRSGWVVLDYGEVVVHVFDPNLREFYGMEDVWSEAKQVLTIQ